MLYREFLQKVAQLVCTLRAIRFRKFEHGHDILSYRQAPEDRHLLWQVAQPEACASVERQASSICSVDLYAPALVAHNSGYAIKAGGFAAAIGPEQRHHLAGMQHKRNITDDDALSISFLKMCNFKSGML